MNKLFKVWCGDCGDHHNITASQVVQASIESTFYVKGDEANYNMYFFRAFCVRCGKPTRVYAYDDDELFEAASGAHKRRNKPSSYQISNKS